jgi:hypothetical protein
MNESKSHLNIEGDPEKDGRMLKCLQKYEEWRKTIENHRIEI